MNIVFIDKDPTKAGNQLPDNMLNASLKDSIQLLSNCVRKKLGKSGELNQEFKTPLGKAEMVAVYPYVLTTPDGSVENSTSPIIPVASELNSPQSLWVRASKANFTWIVKFAKSICKEIAIRTDKDTSESLATIKIIESFSSSLDFDWKGLTPPVIKGASIQDDDAVVCYRGMIHCKKVSWEKRKEGAPDWFNADLNEKLTKKP